MSFFSFGRKPRFFSHEETSRIIAAIREAETKTSGEIRVFIERRCKYVNPIDRAAEIFWNLQMDHTDERNGILVYVASRDHQVAIWGDEGIHRIAGTEFWQNEVTRLITHFSRHAYAEGIVHVVNDIGGVLAEHFPYKPGTDKNELPDDIVFGD
ncbi:TPM domain-containing protein [Flavihumibacter petaseus]|uniref:TPM domain-containing protein n=1 Tax=Flavihumibacter petaseus NBRC 106054 TaxID=1220578 RepID=A0A0E9N455_9BACT|nr:TPM domain-containing protein [Flavihumibacter petaseus]GAO44762.1 hypothetical protein FPE01S_04_00050 [Flavihumibacter petaseus NBRC 106054]